MWIWQVIIQSKCVLAKPPLQNAPPGGAGCVYTSTHAPDSMHVPFGRREELSLVPTYSTVEKWRSEIHSQSWRRFRETSALTFVTGKFGTHLGRPWYNKIQTHATCRPLHSTFMTTNIQVNGRRGWRKGQISNDSRRTRAMTNEKYVFLRIVVN